MAYPSFVEMATSASPGYAALTSGRHQLSGIALAKGIDHFYDLKADDDRVALIANVIVFLNAFLPLRGWNLRQFDAAYLAKTLARLVTDMIGTLKTGAGSEAQRRQA
jgi:hypothetical protein